MLMQLLISALTTDWERRAESPCSLRLAASASSELWTANYLSKKTQSKAGTALVSKDHSSGVGTIDVGEETT